MTFSGHFNSILIIIIIIFFFHSSFCTFHSLSITHRHKHKLRVVTATTHLTQTSPLPISPRDVMAESTHTDTHTMTFLLFVTRWTHNQGHFKIHSSLWSLFHSYLFNGHATIWTLSLSSTIHRHLMYDIMLIFNTSACRLRIL